MIMTAEDVSHPTPWRLELKNVPLADTGDYEGVATIIAADGERVLRLWDVDDDQEELLKRIVSTMNAHETAAKDGPLAASDKFVALFKREPSTPSDLAWMNGYSAARAEHMTADAKRRAAETTAPQRSRIPHPNPQLQAHINAVAAFMEELGPYLGLEDGLVATTEFIEAAKRIRQWCSDKSAECGQLREALTKILGWREIDRNTLGERLRAIEDIASAALALPDVKAPCARCEGTGRLTIYDTATYIGQPCSPIGDEPCPDCSPEKAGDEPK
jgi:hypothetical protein